jgi:hypothetical protein
MKQFLKTIYNIGISIGQARAASMLARQGLHAEAKALMLSK